jgi:hypothetical protein
MKISLKDLIDSKAIYYFAVGFVLVVGALLIQVSNYHECRDFGFSFLYCFFK